MRASLGRGERWRITFDEATLAVVAAQTAEIEGYGPCLRLSCDKAGIAVRWNLHDLGHSSASVATAAGYDVKMFVDRLGHANAAMTRTVCAHAFAASDRAAANWAVAALEDEP